MYPFGFKVILLYKVVLHHTNENNFCTASVSIHLICSHGLWAIIISTFFGYGKISVFSLCFHENFCRLGFFIIEIYESLSTIVYFYLRYISLIKIILIHIQSNFQKQFSVEFRFKLFFISEVF